MAYTFDQIFAADPSNPGNVAANGVVTIFAPGDATQTPLAIMDTAGNPLPNPVTVNANGYGDAFSHATLDRVAWAGGGFSGFFTSYEGIKEEAVAARAAAEEALGGVPARVVDEVAAVAATGAFKGDPGRDGSNVVPTAEAIATEIETPGTPANTALSATFGRKDSIVYLVDDHGAKGDWTGGVTGSGTNDTAALQALANSLPAGATMKFTAGKTYRFDRLTHVCNIDGTGASAVVRPWDGTATTARAAFLVEGAVAASRPIASATADATTITLANPADASGFSVGDRVIIRDDKATVNWDGNTNNTGRYEPNRVVDITPATGTLRLSDPIEWAYDTNPRIQKMTAIIRPSIKFGKVTEIDPGKVWAGDIEAGPHIVQARYADTPTVEMVVEGVNLHAFNFAHCFSPLVTRSTVSKPYRTTEGHGYHTRFTGVRNGLVSHSTSKETRHTVDYVMTYDSGSRDCAAENPASSAYSGHGIGAKRCFSDHDAVASTNTAGSGWSWGNGSFGADYGFHINCPKYRGVGRALTFTSQAQNVTIIDPDWVTDEQAILMATGAGGLVVRGGKVRLTGPAGTSFNATKGVLDGRKTLASTTLPLGDITFDDVELEGANAGLAFESTGVVTIRDGRHKGLSMNYGGSAAIFAYGVAPSELIVDSCSATGAARALVSAAVVPTKRQQVSNNSCSLEGLSAALAFTVTSGTRCFGNDMRTNTGGPGGLTVTGDVVAAKAAGAWFAGNIPSTHDSAR